MFLFLDCGILLNLIKSMALLILAGYSRLFSPRKGEKSTDFKICSPFAVLYIELQTYFDTIVTMPTVY